MTRAVAPKKLYLTEAEVADYVGVPFIEWQTVAAVLSKQGLPQPDPVFGNRRYLPAVRAFLDRRNGLGQHSLPAAADGEENWNDNRGRTARARA